LNPELTFPGSKQIYRLSGTLGAKDNTCFEIDRDHGENAARFAIANKSSLRCASLADSLIF
jgi:hypothetical protein